MSQQYDLIVIGGGAAGLTASGFGALMGAKTALIESNKLGGDCTWTGCIPSKTLLKASRVAHQIRTANRFGLKPLEPQFDFGEVLKHVHQIQQRVYEDADAPPNMERFGVEIISGRARFLDPHTIEVTGQRLSARFFVIAAGSRAAVPDIPGLLPDDYVTNETVFSLKTQPPRLVVLGGGPVGIELAQAFRRLGSEVTVVQQNERILPRDDRELSALLQGMLEAEGVPILMKAKLNSVKRNGPTLQLQVVRDGQNVMLDADKLLIAAGRQALTADLNLDAAGVKHEKSGIPVNPRCQTNVRHIYACGDITGTLQFTHMAEHMAKVAVQNAILHLPARVDKKHVPWCTFTDPELAHVGWGEKELEQRGLSYETYRVPFTKIDRAVTEGESAGLLKVFAKRKSGKVYGVSILGINAGEMASEYALAMRNGIKLKAIANTVHAYPTLSLGNRRAADDWMLQKRTPKLVRWVQRIFLYRGWIVDL